MEDGNRLSSSILRFNSQIVLSFCSASDPDSSNNASFEITDPGYVECVCRRSQFVKEAFVVRGPGGALGAVVVLDDAVRPTPSKAAVLTDINREAAAATSAGSALTALALVPGPLAPHHDSCAPWPKLHRATVACLPPLAHAEQAI